MGRAGEDGEGDGKADVKKKVEEGRDLPEVAGQGRASDNTRSSNNNGPNLLRAYQGQALLRALCALRGTVPRPSLPTCSSDIARASHWVKIPVGFLLYEFTAGAGEGIRVLMRVLGKLRRGLVWPMPSPQSPFPLCTPL